MSEEPGGDWPVVERRVRAGDDPPIHTHTREDETLYVLEGAITDYVGGEEFEAEGGRRGALARGAQQPRISALGSLNGFNPVNSEMAAGAAQDGLLPRPLSRRVRGLPMPAAQHERARR